MINPIGFVNLLRKNNIAFFTGVPDSLLKEFCTAMTSSVDATMHITATNEGCAIGLAAGYYLATGNPGLVYMQNSGLGNAINPLLSLADPEVYGIPMVLLVGWRGEPGHPDEPQHKKQGAIQERLLDSLGFPHVILSADEGEATKQITDILGLMEDRKSPVIIVIRKNLFSTTETSKGEVPRNIVSNQPVTYTEIYYKTLMAREEALKEILQRIRENDKVVSTTGMASREIYEFREKNSGKHDQDFLTVGSMGHCSAIALTLAMFNREKKRRIWCIDGDGAALMHFGTMALIGNLAPNNLMHVILNNGAFDSVGGQPTIGYDTDFCKLAGIFGYKRSWFVTNVNELRAALGEVSNTTDGPTLLEVRIRKGARSDLGRPKTSTKDNMLQFMRS